MRRTVLFLLIFAQGMFGASIFRTSLFRTPKEVAWQTGKVADAPWTGSEYLKATDNTAHRRDYDADIVVIKGGGSIYTVRERHAWHSWCLLINGDPLKYAKVGSSLLVTDAVGAKCTFDVVREEKGE